MTWQTFSPTGSQNLPCWKQWAYSLMFWRETRTKWRYSMNILNIVNEYVHLRPINTYCHCCGRKDLEVFLFEYDEAEYIGCEECIGRITDASGVIDAMLYRMECFDDDEDIELREELAE